MKRRSMSCQEFKTSSSNTSFKIILNINLEWISSFFSGATVADLLILARKSVLGANGGVPQYGRTPKPLIRIHHTAHVRILNAKDSQPGFHFPLSGLRRSFSRDHYPDRRGSTTSLFSMWLTVPRGGSEVANISDLLHKSDCSSIE